MESTTQNSFSNVPVIARRRLQSSPYGALRQLTCVYEDGVLSLQGQVSSYFQKQLAQAMVAGIDGVRQVDNQLVVFDAYENSPAPSAREIWAEPALYRNA